ncbi:MAG: hypothetical protein JO202_17515 [Ktedonobacteraceae bacterium]|nr:hypothetical protein [Ktedonobacteraceae bacterium]
MPQDNSTDTFVMVIPCLEEEQGDTIDPVKKAAADSISEELLDSIDYLDSSTFPTQEEIEDTLRQIEDIYRT